MNDAPDLDCFRFDYVKDEIAFRLSASCIQLFSGDHFWELPPIPGNRPVGKWSDQIFDGFGTNSYLSWYIGLGGRYEFGKGIYLDVDLLYMFIPEGQVAKLITSIFQIGLAMVKKILGYSSV